MNKNLWTIILVAIIILAGIISLLYWIISPGGLFENVGENDLSNLLPVSEEIITPKLPPVPTIGPEERERLKLVAVGDIVDFWPTATTTVQYFKQSSGFWQADYYETPIKEEVFSFNISFGKVLSVNLSSVGDRAIIKYVPEGGTKADFSVLDLENRGAKNLNKNIKTADWSPDGEKLVFYYSDSSFGYKEGIVNTQYLGTFDKDLLKEKSLFNFRLSEDSILSWPIDSNIYISQKPSGLVGQTILSFNTKNKTFMPFVSGNGLMLKWDKSGDYGLLFITGDNGLNPKLKLINKEGISLATFPKLTLPEKCVFSKKEPVLYCAIAENVPANSFWPDDYFQGVFNLREEIYKINLQSMEAEAILNQAAFEIKGIDLSPDEANLLFYDKRSQGLYALELETVISEELTSSPIPMSQ